MPKNQREREGDLIGHTPMMQQYLHADFARLAGCCVAGLYWKLYLMPCALSDQAAFSGSKTTR